MPNGTRGSTCQLEVPPHFVVRQIVEQFDLTCDEFNVVLLNGRVAEPEQILQNDDVVCVFPAYAGG
ncbi:MAG: MoaD/ThiS family protein [Anaerolineales bacterium]|nr:MoaD/ThiS family protein [Anaerolineales bacterium]